MNKARTEAFSDGVFAVAITLLIIDVHVPAPGGEGSLAHRLAEQWPSYVAYVVSFLTIGVIWINHHAFLARLTAVDHSVLSLNLLLLMVIVAIPFSTSLMAEYLDAEEGARLAAAVYGGTFLLMGVLFLLCQWHVLTHRHHLQTAAMTADVRRAVLRRNVVGVAPYSLATVAAAWSAPVTVAICALVGVFYALPTTTQDQPRPR